MALPAVNGNTIQASDMYQLAQPSGGQEHGKYWLANAAYASGAILSQYMQSESKGSTPVSVSIDTADHAASGVGAPGTANLSQYGFQVYAAATAANLAPNVAGNSTIQF